MTAIRSPRRTGSGRVRRPRSARARIPALLAAGAVLAALLGVPTPARAEPAPVPGSVPGSVPDLAGAAPTQATLVTGDRVSITGQPGGPYQVEVEPASRAGAAEPVFLTQAGPDGVYVVPSDVSPEILAGRLDRELFNVTALAEQGYGDAESNQLPVIVSYPEPAGAAGRGFAPNAAELAARTAKLPGTATTVGLASLNGAGVAVQKDRAGRFWQAVNAGERPARIWLDRTAELVLDESVPLVGAPSAWDAGYDGTGVTVAVLDTGIDGSHQDLSGVVAGARSFVDGDSVTDGNGHGTHVASTIAGSGAASGGQYTGVAPGAELLVGKVCSDDGRCPNSAIIAAMEWAAAEQDADVVSMSLGGGPTDGTDPMSQAVNNLTASTGALFVIAAGNDGPGAETVSSPGTADAALTVAATDKSDGLAGFSGRGPRFGDRALKPDIAAPGVGIVAARAAGGTDMGGNATPVGEHYLRASGTSMATPHVAGAAAILAQRYPDWQADELKAGLMSTAQDAGHTVYQQGAGRLDAARAASQPVSATTAQLDYGFQQLPVEGEPVPAPISQPVSYTNRSGAPVTLTITPTLATQDGAPAPEGALVSEDTVTVPAGGTATITVTLDLSGVEAGTYTGAVVATDPATGIRVTVPVGLVLEPPTYLLTVRTLGPDGEPASPFAQDTIRVDGAGEVFAGVRLIDQGVTAVRVPAGTYSIVQAIDWVDGDSRANLAFLSNPEVTVTGDTEVTLDLRQAGQVTFATPTPSEPLNNTISMGYQRGAADGTAFASEVSPSAWTRIWTSPTAPVTVGSYRFWSQHTLGVSEVDLNVLGPDGPDLSPAAPLHTLSGGKATQDGHPGWVPFTGAQNLPLVDVGRGSAEELAGLDVEGKLALIEADGSFEGFLGGRQCGLDIVRVQNVRDAGAAGLVAFPAPDHPCGPVAIPLELVQEQFTGPPKEIGIPNVSVSTMEGLGLRDRLASGPVTIRVKGTPETPHTYVLTPYHEGQVPESLHHPFTRQDLAQVDVAFPAAEPTEFKDSLATYWQDAVFGAVTRTARPGVAATTGPGTRREYIGPLTPDLVRLKSVLSGTGSSRQYRQLLEVFDRPIRTRQHWQLQPLTPGPVTASAAVEAARDPLAPLAPAYVPLCVVCRQVDLLTPNFYLVAGGPDRQQFDGMQSQPGQDSWWDFDLHLYQDGTELPPIELQLGVSGFELPEEPATYRLTAHGPRTETAWTFTSARPTEHLRHPGYECLRLELIGRPAVPCAPQPVLFAGYDLGDTLGMDNAVAAPGRQTFDVYAYHHRSPVPMPAIAGLRLWVSYDGQGWTPARVVPRGDGRFEATVFHPPARARASDQVSLKVEAWDVDGNRVEQVTRDAFTLSSRR